MVRTQKRFRRTIAQLTVASVTFASLGAAVVAAPFVFSPKMHVAKTEIGQLQPLARGPVIQLAKAAPGEAEDCVAVTRMTGPDGKEYATRGMICN